MNLSSRAGAADVVDVQQFLNSHPFSPYQWGIFALSFLIVLMDGFDIAAIGFIAPSLISEWGIDKPSLAPVLSAACLAWRLARWVRARWPTALAANGC